MKKIIKILAIITTLSLLLVGCKKGETKETEINTEGSSSNAYRIGIAQLAEHLALDDAREGFIDGLKELNIEFEESYSNAQGDVGTVNQIIQKFVSDKSDLIYTIATPTAQSAQQATEDSKLPVLFSAVTDAVQAKLVESNEEPGDNLTGTLDEAPMKEQLSLFKEIDDSIENIGIIYNTSEENSGIQVKQAKAFEDELGIKIVEIGVNSINDVQQALNSKVKDLDGIYTITDNMIASSISIISDIAIENKLVTIGAEEAHVEGGILLSNGISYYEIGKQTAEMAKKILVDGVLPEDIPVEKAKNTVKKYNLETVEALGLDKDSKAFEGATDISAEK